MSSKIIMWVKIFYSAKHNHLSRNDILLLSTIPMVIFKHTIKKKHKEKNAKILSKMLFYIHPTSTWEVRDVESQLWHKFICKFQTRN